MQIKKFRAQSMADALSMVKKEFGYQAVILSARDVRNGRGMLGFLKGPCVEVTAAIDTGYADDGRDPVSSGKWFHRRISQGTAPVSRREQKRSLSLVRETAEPRIPLRPGKSVENPLRKGAVGMTLFDLCQEMQNQGIREKTALDLIKELGREVPSNRLLRPEDIRAGLAENLERMGATTWSVKIPRGSQKRIALVGPTGVGKTTTVAKLAAIASLAKKRSTGFITVDDRRVGAIAQLQVYARILNLPMEVASSREEMRKSLRKLRKKELVLIDTPGIGQKHAGQILEVKELLDSARPLETHLLLNAATREKDLSRVVETFSVISVDSLIFTKLDESSQYGDLINQLIRTRIPVSYFTNGPEVPGDIEAATVEKLVDLILAPRAGTGSSSKGMENPESSGRLSGEYGPYLRRSYA